MRKTTIAWANETAQAIRSREFNHIDLDALADEVSAMARQEKRSLERRLEVLIAQLLKWDHQDGKRTRSWGATIAIQRRRTMKLLKDSPSLSPGLSGNLQDIYEGAVQLAVKDTNMSEDPFPSACPYTLDEILSGKSAMI